MRCKNANFHSVSIQSWLCRTAALYRQTIYNFVTKVVSPTNDDKKKKKAGERRNSRDRKENVIVDPSPYL